MCRRKNGVALKWEAATWFFWGAWEGDWGSFQEKEWNSCQSHLSQVNHLAEEMTLPSRLGHHQRGEDARHHHDRVWEESFIIFGRDDCVMFSYTGGSPLCRIRWSRLQTHSNVWKGEWPEEIAKHVILGHLSIFGITWNNNWVPEWRKPKKTVAWGCQYLHYTLNMIWSNIRQDLGSFDKSLA